MLGTMAKFASIGIFSAGPFYVYRLNQDIPAVYPSVDLFLAPFFAQAAAVVDESLWQQQQQQDDITNDDAVFFGSFAVLTSLGMALTAIFLWLGSTFKLANLGTYLPYSVLSGFFLGRRRAALVPGLFGRHGGTVVEDGLLFGRFGAHSEFRPPPPAQSRRGPAHEPTGPKESIFCHFADWRDRDVFLRGPVVDGDDLGGRPARAVVLVGGRIGVPAA